MTDGRLLGRGIQQVESGLACCLCDGHLQRIDVTGSDPGPQHYHYRCQSDDCREGGVLIVERVSKRVIDKEGPACDPLLAKQYQQRTLADGGFMDDYTLDDAVAEVNSAQKSDDLEHMEQALLAALSKCRERKQRGESYAQE